MCESAGKTGSCFPDEGAEALQYVSRIPLPHTGEMANVFLCAALRKDCQNKRRTFSCTKTKDWACGPSAQ